MKTPLNDIQARYAHLDNFIGTEFLQDFDSDLTLVSAVENHWTVYGAETGDAVLKDIRNFLRDQHNDIDAAFEGFKPSIYPPGGGMTTTEWLAEIARLFEQRIQQKPDSQVPG